MKQRFNDAQTASAVPPELLHIAAITQEALLLFNVLTTRFKPAAVIKANRLGVVGTAAICIYNCSHISAQMAQNFKDIRTKGIAVLSEISAELGKVATIEGAADAKKPFIVAATDLQAGDVSFLARFHCNGN